MASSAMQYFFEKNDSLTKDQILGYFDFARSGLSGLTSINSESWTNASCILDVINSENFWQSTGFANFNKQNYAKLNFLSGSSFSFIFAYKLNDKSDNIFVANSNFISGINFGINYAGYPYLEYYHKLYGPITICHTSKANKTGIIHFSIEDGASASIGLFDSESNSFKKILNPIDINVKKSNDYYIGGSPNLDSGRFLSANISELFIYNPDYINSAFFENEFVSGIVCSVNSETITGIVTGQTGVLNGDIIEIKQCSAMTSGLLSEIILSTGNGEYFATHESFIDFNDEIFNKFIQKYLTGYFSGYSGSQIEFLNCSSIFTGKNIYEYDSGYSIEYSITNKFANLARPEYLYNFYNSISLFFDIDDKNILSIYGYSGSYHKINFDQLYYINADGSYGYDNIFGENFSGLYYNGQLQTKSAEYLENIQSGNINFIPQKDYFISGNKIYSNLFYGKNDSNSIFIDFWPHSNFIITGGIISGQALSSVDFNNSLVYLNGQLLTSGQDYIAPNLILRNIDTGYNIIAWQENTLNFQFSIIKNISGSTFSLPFDFNKKTSMVWLNGQRLSLDRDYFEIKKDGQIDILTQNTGVIIYNL